MCYTLNDIISLMKKILITTAIDYTNDVIHVGHAYQKIVADCLTRFYRLLLGKDKVFFLTGTDEHGANIEAEAKKASRRPKEFVDRIVAEDKKQWQALNLSSDRFIRTTDQDHKSTVVNFWQKIFKAGDIYLGRFRGYYCLGCEAYKTKSELIEGSCSLHPTKELQVLKEENYFFRFSKYQKFLKGWFLRHPDFVYPKSRFNEAFSFLKKGLSDFPISRKNVEWGIPVPSDSSQTIYVWFDALINYYTAASASGRKSFWDDKTFILHILGKDNLRHHALIWPAMLKSAGLRLPDKIYAHGFINVEGQKISKSLGNVIRPAKLVDQFGSDAVRYFFLKYGPSAQDVDISVDKIKKVYNSQLANDWGNLIQRVARLLEANNIILERPKGVIESGGDPIASLQDDRLSFSKPVEKHLKSLQIPQALEDISARVGKTNQFINEKEPWHKKGRELDQILKKAVSQIVQIAIDLQPFMPQSSEKIINQFSGKKVKPQAAYFPRIG